MQADAQAKIIGAPLLPEVDFVGFAERFKNPGAPERNLFHAALNVSYEIDFWGKNRAASRAAQETAVASRFNKEVVVLSTIAAVGNTYFQVLSAQDRLRIALENFNAVNRILSLIKQRFEAGTASQLDVAQQESLVAQVRANIPLFDQAVRQNIAVLAVLIGRPPVEVVIKGGNIYQPRDAGAPLRALVPTSRYSRCRGQPRLRRRQRGPGTLFTRQPVADG